MLGQHISKALHGIKKPGKRGYAHFFPLSKRSEGLMWFQVHAQKVKSALWFDRLTCFRGKKKERKKIPCAFLSLLLYRLRPIWAQNGFFSAPASWWGRLKLSLGRHDRPNFQAIFCFDDFRQKGRGLEMEKGMKNWTRIMISSFPDWQSCCIITAAIFMCEHCSRLHRKACHKLG